MAERGGRRKEIPLEHTLAGVVSRLTGDMIALEDIISTLVGAVMVLIIRGVELLVVQIISIIMIFMMYYIYNQSNSRLSGITKGRESYYTEELNKQSIRVSGKYQVRIKQELFTYGVTNILSLGIIGTIVTEVTGNIALIALISGVIYFITNRYLYKRVYNQVRDKVYQAITYNNKGVKVVLSEEEKDKLAQQFLWGRDTVSKEEVKEDVNDTKQTDIEPDGERYETDVTSNQLDRESYEEDKESVVREEPKELYDKEEPKELDDKEEPKELDSGLKEEEEDSYKAEEGESKETGEDVLEEGISETKDESKEVIQDEGKDASEGVTYGKLDVDKMQSIKEERKLKAIHKAINTGFPVNDVVGTQVTIHNKLTTGGMEEESDRESKGIATTQPSSKTTKKVVHRRQKSNVKRDNKREEDSDKGESKTGSTKEEEAYKVKMGEELINNIHIITDVTDLNGKLE